MFQYDRPFREAFRSPDDTSAMLQYPDRRGALPHQFRATVNGRG
jgi:hypothetical protein